jgi:hypothetical protein
MTYKKGMEWLESLSENLNDEQKKQLDESLGYIREDRKTLNGEAQGGRENADKFKADLETMQNTTKALFDSLGVENADQIKGKVEELKGKVQKVEDSKKTDTQLLQDQVSNLSKSLEDLNGKFGQTQEDLKAEKFKGVTNSTKQAIKDGLKSAGVSDALIDPLSTAVFTQAVVTDGAYTIEGKSPQEYALEYGKQNTAFQGVTTPSGVNLGSEPSGTPQINQFATGLAADVMQSLENEK